MWAPSKSLFVALCTLFVCAAGTACQPLPHPFQPDRKAAVMESVAPIDDKVGVFVAGIDEAPPAMERILSGAVAVALNDQAIPASTGSANSVSFLLQGMAQVSNEGWLGIHWQLIGPQGDITGLFDQVALVDNHAWQNGDPGLATFLARDAAERVSDLVRPTEETSVARQLTVSVPVVTGAPGDGDTALAQAMSLALASRKLALIPDHQTTDLSVLGRVAVTPAGAEEQVEISWTVYDVDGHELGDISQSNRVPKGTLDGRWGEIAGIVANYGADGIASLIDAAGIR